MYSLLNCAVNMTITVNSDYKKSAIQRWLRTFCAKNLSTIGCICCFGLFSGLENEVVKPADIAFSQNAQVEAQAEEQPPKCGGAPDGAGQAGAAEDGESRAGYHQQGGGPAQPYATDG